MRGVDRTVVLTGVTEIEYIKGRGHSLGIDQRWKDVADAALTFVKRFV